MAVSVGDQIPNVPVMIMRDGSPAKVQTTEIFSGKTVALFSVPGAFTPTCSAQHLPSFITHAAELKGKGIDVIACMSVNDIFVMDAWAKDQNAGDAVLMVADGNAELAKALGLEMDGTGFGMGTRSQRFSLVVKDGAVTHLFVEEPGKYDVSSAEHMLGQL